MLLIIPSLLWLVLCCKALQTPTYSRSWADAYSLAKISVADLIPEEKIRLVTGTNSSSPCIGNIGPINHSKFFIPGLCLQDGPAGLRLLDNVTGFPTGINVASTFSRRLMTARGVALGEESRGKGVNVLLAPAMDIMRNPKAGRAWESFGPDPYLSGEAAHATVTGIQSQGVMACAKHFLANNQEHWRYGLSANVDDRTLRETYFYPFLRSIEAGVTSVMCAYNRLNGTSSCHNAGLLGPKGLLRSNGFQGFVVSDWWATHDMASDNANAGLDMEMPGGSNIIGGGVYGQNLQAAVNNKTVTQARLDEMVTRIFASWYSVSQDLGYPRLALQQSVRSDAHTALVREIAGASTVLLKNLRTSSTIKGLPFTSNLKTLAIVGQDAKMPKKDCKSNECDEGTMSVGWGSGSNSLQYLVPPIDAIQSFSHAAITASLSNDLISGANAAKGKDAALVFVNAMSGELGAYDIVDWNEGDRNDLNLWFDGGKLIEAVAAQCSNTVVVVHSVGPVYMKWSSHPNVTAILYAGAPGEQTGPALVDVLWGNRNPSGRLPFSIADDEKAYGTSIMYFGDVSNISYSEKLLLDYRYMEANNLTPRFEFGFGLSYTTFTYSSLVVSAATRIVSFNITNKGSVDGTEIPQLYLGYPAAHYAAYPDDPKKVLRGFEEIGVKVGQTANVKIVLTERDLSIWDSTRGVYVRPAGTFTVSVGASSRDIRLVGWL